MHVLNVMFSKGLGGIEQACVDYCEALLHKGVRVSVIIPPNAPVKEALVSLRKVNIHEVKNLGNWDIFAKAYIKRIVEALHPDCVISHGGRAAQLMASTAKKQKIFHVGVLHNYSTKRFGGVDALFAVSKDIRRNAVVSTGIDDDNVVHVPNMIRPIADLYQRDGYFDPPVIATMGRFVAKKGFDVFIGACGKLAQDGIDFQAVVGGSGECESALKQQVKELGLEDKVRFIGWIKDKHAYYEDADICVVPSLHEPFGIVLLEAMMYGKPLITSDAEGPKEIVTPDKDALMVPKGEVEALAKAMELLIKDRTLALNLVQEARVTVGHYEVEVVAERLLNAIGQVMKSKISCVDA